ncbi:MAG: hypothetical protein AAFO73_11900 [Pseudomonadota bacterium]
MRRNFVKLFCSAALIAGSAMTAQATSHGNTILFDKTYATVGKWKVLAQSVGGDTCAAETDNVQKSLRIMYTEYTGDWHIGTPYYQNDRPAASIGSGRTPGTTDGVQLETIPVHGWAMYRFDRGPFLDALKRDSFFSMSINGPRQDWSLAGSSRAIALVEECARNLGKRPRRKVATRTQPKAPPKPSANSGGGSFFGGPGSGNAANGASIYENAVRGWDVYQEKRNGQFLACYATKRSNGQEFAIGYSSREGWLLGMRYPIQRDQDGNLFVDTQRFAVRYEKGPGMAILRMNRPILNAIKAGSNATMDLFRGGLNLNLSGSTAAILKVEECYNTQGTGVRTGVSSAPSKPRVVQRQQNTANAGPNVCPRPGSVRSPRSGSPTIVRFVRGANTPAIVFYWIDFNGNEVEMGIWDGNQFELQSTSGHLFIAKDRNGSCRGGVYQAMPGGYSEFVVN